MPASEFSGLDGLTERISLTRVFHEKCARRDETILRTPDSSGLAPLTGRAEPAPPELVWTRRILHDEIRHAISGLMFLYGDRANFNEFVPVVAVGPMPPMAGC